MKDLTNKSFEDIADAIIDTMDIDAILATLHTMLVSNMEAMEDEELAEYLSFYGIEG